MFNGASLWNVSTILFCKFVKAVFFLTVCYKIPVENKILEMRKSHGNYAKFYIKKGVLERGFLDTF